MQDSPTGGKRFQIWGVGKNIHYFYWVETNSKKRGTESRTLFLRRGNAFYKRRKYTTKHVYYSYEDLQNSTTGGI